MTLRAPLLTAGLAGLLMVSGCGGERPSAAADPFIARAADAEEREALEEARDDIDAEMRRLAAEKDAEIERLRMERKDLEALLREKGLEP